MKNRIAIIGGGGLGVCTALELANHGFKVHLFEERDDLIRKASFANEGKIHIGLVYALDSPHKTAKEMIRGALHFMAYLKRWIDLNPEDVLSTPFYYLNHARSLLKKEQLLNHYHNCQKVFQEAVSHYNYRYLDLFDSLEAKLIRNESALQHFNPEWVESLYLTNEYAVDVRQIATLLRSAALDNGNVSVYLNTRVTSIKRTKRNYELTLLQDREPQHEAFDIVINASWNGRLELDRQLGLVPNHPWSYRYKLATRVAARIKEEVLPSVTIVQGPFGDLVNFKDQGMYYSWYPKGRMGWSEALSPPDWEEEFIHAVRLDVSKQSYLELGKIIPALNDLHFEDAAIDPVGGVIFAFGNKEVDLVESRLHSRVEVGIQSNDNYYSVNTGKYTLIPLLAVELASLIMS